ncbi:hypothetical protein FPV67DRAFT_563842 [Lyophyllum atratum]|nr:hypothetical protein FPV67DRAFT_563842 [Lyophyllum atratum]
MSDLEIHTLCSKFDIEILEEASYVLWNVWKAMYPRYSTLQACISALAEDSGLCQALKRAHGQKRYDGCGNGVSGKSTHICLRWGWATVAGAPHALPAGDTSVQSQVKQLLTELRPAMTRLVKGELVLRTWTPGASVIGTEMAAFVRALRIPYLNGKPNVLLHDLGSFERDPSLAARLQNIFMPNHRAFVLRISLTTTARPARKFRAVQVLVPYLIVNSRLGDCKEQCIRGREIQI